MNGKGIRIISKTLGGILALLFLCIIASHDKNIQKLISSAIANKIDSVIEGKLSFSSILISPYGALILKDVLVLDPTPYTADTFEKGYATTDTLFYAGSITTSFNLAGLFKGEGLHLGRVKIKDGGLFIVTEPPEERGRKNNMAVLIKPKERDSTFVAQPGPALFDIRRVNINNFRFRLVNFAKEKKEGGKAYSGYGINFEDMDAAINLRAHHVSFSGGRMGGIVDHMDIREKCGYTVNELQGDAISGLGKTEIYDLFLQDSVSTVRLRNLNFTFKNITYFKDFVNKVRIDANLSDSHVGMQTVNYFCRGSMNGNELEFDIDGGHVEGTVNNLGISSLHFNEIVSGMSGTVKAQVGQVVPDVNNLTLDVKIPDCNFTTAQMSVFLTNWARKSGKEVDLGKLAPGEKLVADVFCRGNINDLQVGAAIGSASFGELDFKGRVKETYRKRTPLTVSGTFSADSLHLGRAIGNDKLGRTVGSGAFSTVLGKPMKFTLDTLAINDIYALGNRFRGIEVKGGLADNTASGSLISSDPDLKFNIDALVDLKPVSGRSRYKMDATIDNADLYAMGLDKKQFASRFNTLINVDLVQEGNLLLGDASIEKINIDRGEGYEDIGDIKLNASQENGDQRMLLTSPLADIRYSSSGPVKAFTGDMQDLTSRKYLPALSGKEVQKDSSETYSISVDFHDSRRLMNYLLPDLYVADSSTVYLTARDGIMDMEFRSPRLAYGKRFAKNLLLKVFNDSTSFSTRITMEELNAGGILMHNPLITTKAAEDSVSIGINYDNINGNDNFGNFRVDTRFSRDEDNSLIIEAKPVGSSFGSSTELWTISDSPVTIHGKDFHFDKLKIENGVQFIYLDGGYSQNEIDTLGVYINKIDLSLVDKVLTESIGLKGTTTGQAIITSPSLTNLGMIVNIGCDSLEVSGAKGGTFRITSLWNESDKKIYGMIRNTLDGNDMFIAEGNYRPKGKEYGASMEFNNFALAIAAPLLNKIFTETGGYIDGMLQLSGRGNEELSVKSDGINLKDATLRLSSTGVTYTLNGPIHINDNGIFLEKIDIRDGYNGHGSLSGSVSHDKLANMALDASATLNDLDVIDIPEGHGLSGHVKASGGVKVKGPLNGLIVDADLVTSNSADVHVPLSGALSSNSDNILTFTKPQIQMDPYEQMLREKKQKETKARSDFRAKGRIRITPDLRAFMEINKSVGNIITISGTGDIDLELRPIKSQFGLNGTYMIDKGNYHFVVPGILEKDFNIQNGSFVKFGGDVADTEMDISAIYETRTSLGTLIADSTVVATRRLVQCGLNISGKLSNPSIKFSVTVPDLDPTTKSKVDGALNTEDKIQKQFVALLLFGSFLPSEQSGVFNQNNILYSNIGEVVSSQINSIFQKLDIPLDIGLGYQETNTGNNAFDVAVSTQLFNNRVVVNGSVGNRKYNSGSVTTTSGDIVGDIDIEFKLDKEGKFRLNAFSHSADQYTSYLDNSQRNGIGASYQQEYNTFREFWHNLFKKRPKKAENQQEEPEIVPGAGNVIIKIENDSRKAISDTLNLR